ncbi:MAG TPA: MOSC domain-containing protein [Burkholderiaceae bacterium]|nr:MOSC domain-containing protein [Burkholderiaceae bacterium]
MPVAQVVAVHTSPTHGFSKQAQPVVRLQMGLGVAGDAHAGMTVQHRSRVARNPSQPNLRQVHLLHVELFDMLAERGFAVRPGDLGENITTRGIDLLALPAGTRLRLGAAAEVELTGLRNPCVQIDRFQRGLMAAVLDRDAAGALIRKAGVMAVVTAEGAIQPGDAVAPVLPPLPHRSLEPV